MREKQDSFASFAITPACTSGATRAMKPLAWQPGLATRFEDAIFARWPASSAMP